MTNRRIALLPGDGIGPEVLRSAEAVVRAALPDADRWTWTQFGWGSERYLAEGAMMPVDGIEQLRGFDAILLGAVGDPRVPDHVTLHGLLLPIRRAFDQYLCVRPARLFPGIASPLAAPGMIDLLIVRENTEGEYADRGERGIDASGQEVATQVNVFTREGCRRIIDAAFTLAAGRRGHVTSITKSNAQRFGMVLWDEVFQEVASRHPTIGTASLLVDAAAMELVRRPSRFDVVVASNLFGDILSDLAAAVTGSIGLAPSANLDPTRRAPSMFEPVHGSAPDIAGQGIANPVAAVLAGAMMLMHLGETDAARRVERAVETVLARRTALTPDLGGNAGTDQVTEALIRALSA
ncbi:MAG: isocitrate/isopropylmalate dehydrogenase family protein [Gemmatimonadales bacterium]